MEYIPLKEIAEITMGQSPDSKSYNDSGEGLPFFQGNADFGELHPETRIWCSEPKKIAKANDILISVRAPIGALNYAKEECCIGRGLAAITVDNPEKRNYVYHLLKARNVDLNRQGTGSTFKAIGKKVLESLQVPVVSESIEKQSMQLMDAVEAIIKLRSVQMQKLDTLIKARFVELFGMPGIDSKGWGLTALGGCCEINPKKNKDKRLVPELEVSFVPMPAVSEDGVIDTTETRTYGEVKTGFTYFSENDVLFAKITPCMENGKGAVATKLRNGIGFGSTEFHVLRPFEDISNPYWIYYLTTFEVFRRDAEKKMTGSAGQRRVPAAFLEEYKTTLPPIGLQREFASFVKQVDKSKVAIQKSLNKTQLLFDSLMQEYFG